tara:strand:+ start:228 stop:908 length:681 start_codon:yes stop_codon:yes gene_type:complete
MRGGSKGLPNKNIKELQGKPLMAYSIEQALDSQLFEHVVVSTDSKKIADMAKSWGAKVWFLRPLNLATDNAPKIPVIRHAFQESELFFDQKFDILVDLDATSPLRKVSDIIEAHNKFIDDKADILISASIAKKNPYFNMVELINGKVKLIKQLKKTPEFRQKAPQVFDMNASIYIWKRRTLLNYDSLFLKNTSLYIMPQKRSIDIDSQLDWDFVSYLMGKSNNLDD